MSSTPRPISSSPVAWRAWLVPLGLLLLTCAAYLGGVWDAGYIWDDDAYVTDNLTLRSAAGLSDIWLRPRATPQYYPLVHSTFWVEYQLWQLDPRGYHVVNVLLHASSAILLWRLLQRLEVPGSVLAAAIFAVHPVHVESVAWITERKNVLCGLFYLSALLAYLRADPLEALPEPKRGRQVPAPLHKVWYVAALGLYICALLSKTVACSLPAVLVLLMWWRRGTLRSTDWLRVAPMFALGLVSAFGTVWLEKYHVGAEGVAWDLSLPERLLIAGRAVWFYAWKLLVPWPLCFNYPHWQIDVRTWWQWLFPVGVLAMLAAAWLARRRLGRGPLVALLIFVGNLLPAIGFFDVYPMRYSFVADHFQYLASVGLIVLAAAAWSVFKQSRTGRPYGLVVLCELVVVALLATLTWHQLPAYHNAETLWADTLEKNPSSWMAHNNLAEMSELRHDLVAAMNHLQAATQLRPDLPEIHYNLGALLLWNGKVPEARQQMFATLDANPNHPMATLCLAWIMATDRGGQHDPLSAIHLATSAVKTGRPGPQGTAVLAAVFAEAGDFHTAERLAERGHRLAIEAKKTELAAVCEKYRKAYAAGRLDHDITRMPPH